MGMQGPLTAQALGRSPYDDVVEGEGHDDPSQSAQQYDHRGRPINPDTKRINREIVRSHNEVMLVIGVAEPENPNTGPEAESQRQHDAFEETIGRRLDSNARRCLEMVGLFGIHGLRQRILIYREYSQIPFYDLYKRTRSDFSLQRDLLPGAATGMVTHFIDRMMHRLWRLDKERQFARRIALDVWSYFRTHMKYFASMQRLGLIATEQWLPWPSYFIPFTKYSPIPRPPPLKGFDPQSLLHWFGSAVVSAAPFLLWVMVLRIARDLQPEVWMQIFSRLPSTAFLGRRIPPPLPSPSPPQKLEEQAPVPEIAVDVADEQATSYPQEQETSDGPEDEVGPSAPRNDHFMARDDDDATDEEENEGMNTTLISFDVEATEASPDGPPGLWSAELRPSMASDSKGEVLPIYLDTLLTQLPSLLATNIFTDSIVRLLMAPYEATALRLMARFFCVQHDLPCDGIYPVNVLSSLSLRSLVNLLQAELLHIMVSAEIWAVFSGLAQHYHLSDKEWKEEEKKNIAEQEQQEQQQQQQANEEQQGQQVQNTLDTDV